MQPDKPTPASSLDDLKPGLPSPGWRRWFGPGAFIALGIFVLGRVALEPVRSVSQVDEAGMDPFGAVEIFRLRRNPVPVEVAFLGSSQTIWGIVTDAVSKKLGRKPSRVVNLGTAGGTPFEMWNLVRRNPKEFDRLRLAVIEVNPFILRPGLEGDPRVFASVSSRASLTERLLLRDPEVRLWQTAEWVLPLNSVRRSLESALHNIVGNRTWRELDPRSRRPHQTQCQSGAGAPTAGSRRKERHTISPESAAKRMLGSWQISSFQDHALRSLLQWMEDRHIPVVLHQLPVHPEVAELVRHDPRFAGSYEHYCDYVDTIEPAPRAIFRSLDPAESGGDADCMADRTHLNESGARLYSARLAERVRPYMRRTPPPQRNADRKIVTPRGRSRAASCRLHHPPSGVATGEPRQSLMRTTPCRQGASVR